MDQSEQSTMALPQEGLAFSEVPSSALADHHRWIDQILPGYLHLWI
jgi:hypothetical protein